MNLPFLQAPLHLQIQMLEVVLPGSTCLPRSCVTADPQTHVTLLHAPLAARLPTVPKPNFNAFTLDSHSCSPSNTAFKAYPGCPYFFLQRLVHSSACAQLLCRTVMLLHVANSAAAPYSRLAVLATKQRPSCLHTACNAFARKTMPPQSLHPCNWLVLADQSTTLPAPTAPFLQPYYPLLQLTA